MAHCEPVKTRHAVEGAEPRICAGTAADWHLRVHKLQALIHKQLYWPGEFLRLG